MGPENYYVSNYFKTYKLIYSDIEKIDIIPAGRLLIVTFILKAKGSFGKKIVFLASKNLYEIFLKENPEIDQLFKSLFLENKTESGLDS